MTDTAREGRRVSADHYRSDVALFAPILDRCPDGPDAWKWLADARVIEGNPARAVPLYEELEGRDAGGRSRGRRRLRRALAGSAIRSLRPRSCRGHSLAPT